MMLAKVEFTMDRNQSKGYDLKEHLEWYLSELCTKLEADKVDVTYRLTVEEF